MSLNDTFTCRQYAHHINDINGQIFLDKAKDSRTNGIAAAQLAAFPDASKDVVLFSSEQTISLQCTYIVDMLRS